MKIDNLCVSFEGDLNCIAGATSRNGAFIWDVRKGKIITRFNEVTFTFSSVENYLHKICVSHISSISSSRDLISRNVNAVSAFSSGWKLYNNLKVILCFYKWLFSLPNTAKNHIQNHGWWFVSPLMISLSSSSMVRMVYSVYHGAIRILRGLLLVVEMDSGQSSFPRYLYSDNTKLQYLPFVKVLNVLPFFTVSSGPLTVKSSISTNILLLCLVVIGARTTSRILIYHRSHWGREYELESQILISLFWTVKIKLGARNKPLVNIITWYC